MTPATLLATAARYERTYGCRKGDGGTADQLRAGAEAMARVAELEAALEKARDDARWAYIEGAMDEADGGVFP